MAAMVASAKSAAAKGVRIEFRKDMFPPREGNRPSFVSMAGFHRKSGVQGGGPPPACPDLIKSPGVVDFYLGTDRVAFGIDAHLDGTRRQRGLRRVVEQTMFTRRAGWRDHVGCGHLALRIDGEPDVRDASGLRARGGRRVIRAARRVGRVPRSRGRAAIEPAAGGAGGDDGGLQARPPAGGGMTLVAVTGLLRPAAAARPPAAAARRPAAAAGSSAAKVDPSAAAEGAAAARRPASLPSPPRHRRSSRPGPETRA